MVESQVLLNRLTLQYFHGSFVSVIDIYSMFQFHQLSTNSPQLD